MCVGLWGGDAARGALRGARVPLTVRGLLKVQVERVNIKGHCGHDVDVSWGGEGREEGRQGGRGVVHRERPGVRQKERRRRRRRRRREEEKEERVGSRKGRMEKRMGRK